ncbi:hypothetical protein EMCG_06494 [[Emmonsia] crescens]|uniref:Uncharacterized protein n=1 Tax=[Emmonsia] crescens TaxID=73230 RepID=A0A0G2J6Q3_9EURO|nr:hypothetical protein EMCG_06494 [Emmonsia crescens UAMH 3008]
MDDPDKSTSIQKDAVRNDDPPAYSAYIDEKSSKDTILTAVGEESQQATGTYAFNLNSVIQVPPLQPGASNDAVEIMRGTVTDDHIAAFHFAIEVGSDGKMTREEFRWRKLKKGNDDAKGRGFKLLMSSGQSNASGGCWALMVVMTALRLWWLHVGSRANTAVIGKGENIHNNQSIP